ncbi:MAG: TrkH family potassium uptake protein [bacterium]
MLPEVFLGLYDQDGTAKVFFLSFIIAFSFGLLLWFPARKSRHELKAKDGFLIVISAWVAMVACGSLPFMLSAQPDMDLADAIFEASSGLTTTGATVIAGLDHLPRSILLYRQKLQWLGGMGIIVLAVAILPILRIGGMQLLRAETPGPMKDSKLTPRITETAKTLWFTYLGLTVLCAVSFYLAGMNLFDAISHSFSTVSTGGLSTHDASFAFFDSPLIELIAVIFMMLSSFNFAIHFMAWRSASTQPYRNDTEIKTFIRVVIAVTFIVTIFLALTHTSGKNILHDFRLALFQTVSVISSTGYSTAPFYDWPSFIPLFLLMVGFIGGCAGSTTGGMKMIRMILIYKQGHREIKRLIHPHAAIPIKVGGRTMSEKVINAVWGFFALYLAVFCLFSLALTATGLDIITSVSTVASSINNLGPALGEAAQNYSSLNPPAKWILSLTMIMGRLEVFTVMVLLTPDFWRD